MPTMSNGKKRGIHSGVREQQRAFTVRDMPLSERPRERLAKLGAEALSAAELLAIVLGRGVKGEPVTATAQNLLNNFGDLRRVLSASKEELCSLHGIGPAKAAQIKAIDGIARRLEGIEDDSVSQRGPVIKGPEDVVRVVRPALKGKKKEQFLALLLNTRNHVSHLNRVEAVSTGNLDSSIVHPREVFQPAIAASAASVIFVHNHPSGDPQPSEEDVKLTRRLVEVGELVGIAVLDHIVVCDSSFVSMKSKGLM